MSASKLNMIDLSWQALFMVAILGFCTYCAHSPARTGTDVVTTRYEIPTDPSFYHRAKFGTTLAIILKPKDGKAYSDRGLAFINLGQYQKAIDDCNTAIRLGSLGTRESITYATRGGAFLKLNELYFAENDCNKAIELDKKSENHEGSMVAYGTRGALYIRMKHYEKALEDENKVIAMLESGHEVCPIDFKSQAYESRGWLHASLNEFSQAVEDYSAAIKINPKQASSYYFRGWVYGTEGQRDKAIDDYNQAKMLDPSYASKPITTLGASW